MAQMMFSIETIRICSVFLPSKLVRHANLILAWKVLIKNSLTDY